MLYRVLYQKFCLTYGALECYFKNMGLPVSRLLSELCWVQRGREQEEIGLIRTNMTFIREEEKGNFGIP